MLTQTELSLNLRYLKFLGRLGFLPIIFHETTGKFQVIRGQNHSRWCMFVVSSQLTLAYAALSLTIKVYHVDIVSAIRKFLIEFIFVYSFEQALCMGLWMFIKWPGACEALCNESFGAEKNGSRRSEKNKLKRKLGEYTWLELLTIILPIGILPWGTMVVVIKQITTTTFAEKSVFSMILTGLNLLAELLSILMCTTSFYWVLLNQILFMGHVCHTMEVQLTQLG